MSDIIVIHMDDGVINAVYHGKNKPEVIVIDLDIDGHNEFDLTPIPDPDNMSKSKPGHLFDPFLVHDAGYVKEMKRRLRLWDLIEKRRNKLAGTTFTPVTES
jgi:hypothetical protein